ncbi:hmg box protein [Stagonosporopsis vannaccii]|nr:hmg box protein [Stagonosporopsis vannaccii]
MPQQAARAFSQKDLPPSVETAYYRKCIELRRRINDIEENNDGTRQRIQRLNRGIQKMRLERAFLLDRLQKHQEYSMDDSDRSSSPPPTPTDKPLRSKRSHRKGTPPAAAGGGTAPDSSARGHSGAPHAASPGEQGTHLAISHPHAVNPMSSAQSTPDPSRHTNPFFSSVGASASPHASHSAVNGTQNALPPLHSLPGMQPQPQAQQTPTPRAYFDPAYDAERPTPAPVESEAGRPRAYSGAQQPQPPQQQHAEAPQNGDTEMRDVGLTSVNNGQ